MKIIIAGGRDFTEYNTLKEECDKIIQRLQATDITIVSGHANGADKLGEKYALEREYSLEIFPADWKTHGRAAGPVRNREMAEYADILIAFWDARSRDTKNMIDQAQLNKVGTYIIFY